jgi:hypothetical protein
VSESGFTDGVTMHRVFTEATLESLSDIWDVERGQLAPEQARRITVDDALVDPSETALSLPIPLIEALRLARNSSARVTRASGVEFVALYEAVRLTIQGRSCTMDVIESPPGMPVLIGRFSLLHLDLVIDFDSGELIGNPAHGGEHMYEMY